MDIYSVIAGELGARLSQVTAAVRLIDEGCTVPFIARYRKEATGGLNDEQLRRLDERLTYLRGLEERRAQILASVEEQGKLTPELRARIEAADALVTLEDLYLPYRPKRRTRATMARERGLEPLADQILAQAALPAVKALPLDGLAAPFVTPADADVPEDRLVPDTAAALQGASDILAERLSDDAGVRALVRSLTREKGTLVTAARSDKDAKDSKTDRGDRRAVYDMYAAYEEALSTIPGHRILAVNRGEKEKFLSVSVTAPEAEILAHLEASLARVAPDGAPSAEILAFLSAAARDAYRRLIAPAIERGLRAELTGRAEDGAIRVFRENLRQLLMQPPIAGRTVLGWDPAYRTGCKLAVVDPTGRVLDTAVVYPTPPQNRVDETIRDVKAMIRRYGVSLISLGNGTASRESEQVIARILREMKLEAADPAARGQAASLAYVIVNEAGASVYSASRLASEEFPQFDVGQRSAASMARRLQDPLAELVKIDPRSIGVGQYQHDIDEARLGSALSGVVEDCVNAVGVDLNTASFSLLSYVSGISRTVAANIVAWRDANGPFAYRRSLLKVRGLGPKAYEQCAGFLRISGGTEPLDATAVHPENYGAVHALLRETSLPCSTEGFAHLRAAAGDVHAAAARLGIGEITLRDILAELEKPGRDPREDMPAPLLRADILSLEDLTPGMQLKGTVRNIVDFGAFVDIGVHQDGLVHISRMSRRFIRHPMEVVRVGDVVDVTVISVDLAKKRIALSMTGMPDDRSGHIK